eukprot:11084026-Karenia_brevis.AAC.1
MHQMPRPAPRAHKKKQNGQPQMGARRMAQARARECPHQESKMCAAPLETAGEQRTNQSAAQDAK